MPPRAATPPLYLSTIKMYLSSVKNSLFLDSWSQLILRLTILQSNYSKYFFFNALFLPAWTPPTLSKSLLYVRTFSPVRWHISVITPLTKAKAEGLSHVQQVLD